MHRIGLVIVALLVGGCAAHHCAAPVAGTAIEDDAITARALAFDPPGVIDELAPDLSREPRERSAFVGYDEQRTSFSYVRYDDRQISHRGGRFERQAIIETFGVSHR